MPRIDKAQKRLARAVERLESARRAQTDRLAELASGWADDAMVVGHLPFLGRFCARACAGHERDDMIAYQPGSLVCLERGEDGVFRLAWMVRPELL